MAIVINKAAVRRSLEQWFVAARAGETMGARETAELSAHEAAAQSSDFFYQLLCDDEDSFQHVEGDASQATLVAGEDIREGSVVGVTADGVVYAAPSAAGETTEPEHPPEAKADEAQSEDDFF